MMRYQPPSLSSLRSLGRELRDSYAKDHHQRLYFIALLEYITITTSSELPKNILKILMGTAIFELEAIYNEYFYYNKYFYWSAEHSKMVTLIQEKLKISKDNPLTDETRLYYLHKFYKYAKKNISDEDIQNLNKLDKHPIWKNKESFEKSIHDALKYLKQRDTKRIDQLVYATPELVALRKGTKKLPSQYRAARENRWTWFQSSDREPMLKLIDFIDDSFYYLYPASESDKIKRLQEAESRARRGLILFVLLDINSTYRCKWLNSPKGTFLSNGSDLFKESLQILNITSLKQLTHDQKINLLKALLDHIDEIRKDEKFYNHKKEEWKKEGYGDLDKELMKLRERIDQVKVIEEEKKLTPSTTAWVVSSGTSYATQYGVSYLLKQSAVASIGSLIATSVGGPLTGIAVYVGGTLLMTGLGQLIGESVMTAATAYVYTWILEKIGSSVGGKAAEYITYRFNPTKEGLEELRKKLSPEDEKAFRRWVNTLLDLPEDIFSEQEKKQIRNVLGIEKGEKLKPLSVQVKQDAKIENDIQVENDQETPKVKFF